MNCITNFHSQYGWSIQLPPQWEVLSAADEAPMESLHSTVFGWSQDWSASITWMEAPTVEAAVASQFLSLTILAGRLPIHDVEALTKKLFATIGKIQESSAIELADGRQALETIESFCQETEMRKGYQLIFPRAFKYGQSPRFERLCFYAPAEQFDDLIPQVRAACRSFHSS